MKITGKLDSFSLSSPVEKNCVKARAKLTNAEVRKAAKANEDVPSFMGISLVISWG